MNSTESGAWGLVDWGEGGRDEQERELLLIMGLSLLSSKLTKYLWLPVAYRISSLTRQNNKNNYHMLSAYNVRSTTLGALQALSHLILAQIV